MRLRRAFGVDVRQSDRFCFGFPDVNRFVRFVRLIVRLFVVVLGVVSALVIFVFFVRAGLLVMRVVFVRVMFVAVRFESRAFVLRFRDVLGQRCRFFLGQMFVVMFFCRVRGGVGVSFVLRLNVAIVLVARFVVMSFRSVFASGCDLVERARGVQSQLVVRIF